MNEFEDHAKEVATRSALAANGKESEFFDVARFRHEERIALEPMIDASLAYTDEPKKLGGFGAQSLDFFRQFLHSVLTYRY